ncbi:hypothetical protein DCS_00221 [Drechmeria coniospora]|uniref:F-box domain-containing protein n=1 Tax=Drechmeria coniospora TaxID=98403 RepID=A0A151GPS7_DRECN|nr:hypothetical protein DCS_00221 [Drechmeria coniospora]KYK59093.1 hypothetical protein DCS_00221 [Drechmeria coniospora]
MSQTTANMTSWHCFPAEIRYMVLEVLMQDGCRLADFATVSREWQTTIERHNFSRIKLTPSRLANFGSMVHRNRSLVRYIWLCLELEKYDCTQCDFPFSRGMSNADNTMIITAFQDLFSHLSAWEPDGDLLLDISVHSLSDSEHWFKYLTFEPDNDSNAYGRVQHIEQSLLFKASDHHHGWITGRQPSIPSYAACHKPFDEIMGEGPFDNEQEEYKWWQQLPLVPAVTGVLLRQQNRRRWKPDALAHMFARLPGLRQIHYEPWREWDNIIQRDTDQGKCYYAGLLFSVTSIV